MSSSDPNPAENQLLLDAIEHHKNARFSRRRHCIGGASATADHPDALNLLGVIAVAGGSRGTIAAELIARSVAIAPTFGSLNTRRSVAQSRAAR